MVWGKGGVGERLWCMGGVLEGGSHGGERTRLIVARRCPFPESGNCRALRSPHSRQDDSDVRPGPAPAGRPRCARRRGTTAAATDALKYALRSHVQR